MSEKVPVLSLLLKHYPTESHDELFSSLGWESLISADKSAEEKATWANTCAIRMSLCLIRCGMVLHTGGMKIQKGEHKGRRIEASRAKLAHYLETKAVWGKPTFVETSAAKMMADIGTDGGVISFGPLPGYDGGHIDVIHGSTSILSMAIHFLTGAPANTYSCSSECYWDAAEYRFWKAGG
jgi:hypothetical protein